MGGAEEGGGSTEPDSVACYLRLSGAKPGRERRAGPGGREGRSGGEEPGLLRRRLPGARPDREEKEKKPGQEAAGARGGVAHFPTEWNGTCGLWRVVPPCHRDRCRPTSPGFVNRERRKIAHLRTGETGRSRRRWKGKVDSRKSICNFVTCRKMALVARAIDNKSQNNIHSYSFLLHDINHRIS